MGRGQGAEPQEAGREGETPHGWPPGRQKGAPSQESSLPRGAQGSLSSLCVPRPSLGTRPSTHTTHLHTPQKRVPRTQRAQNNTIPTAQPMLPCRV